jgi:lysyl-tRNA synthetase, class II
MTTTYNMIFVSSSNIRSLGYNKENSTLAVVFNNNSLYLYNDVPESVFLNFFTLSSSTDSAGNTTYIKKSIGKYFNAQIKNKYSFDRIN